MKMTIHDDPEALAKRLRALQKLKTMHVKVGLPTSAGGRLRFILAVQEHGSPIMHIPARPVIRPALAKPETRSAMAEAMKDVVRAAWVGDEDEAALPWKLPARPARTGSVPISILISRCPTVL